MSNLERNAKKNEGMGGGDIDLGIKTWKQQGAKRYLGKGIADHWGVAKHDKQQNIREQRNIEK